MGFFRQLVGNLLVQAAPATSSPTPQPDLYNYAWHLWLRHFTGDTNALAAQIQIQYPSVPKAEIEVLLGQIWDELGWAMSQFYDVRDGKQSAEQAAAAVQEHLPRLSAENLRGLLARCQQSAAR